ncbi:MAG: ribosomal L7Ae/L30e/S12e/Gadd45 family protein [Oscillospiraceae bacterium]|nr:ribosomal L7Ae/L30e/S12e/Gadd45 family protein [Oscillospiraceae bacterium]
MDKALNFLGMCKKAGKLLTGEDGVSGAARNGEAALIMTASDTASNTTKKALNLSEWGRAPHVRLPWDKDTLGELLDKRVCAILALTDRGMALAFAEKLAARDPAYAQTAEVLRAASARKGRKAHD